MDATVAAALDRYSWYHCIDIEPGIQTPGQKIILPIQAPIMSELRRHDLAGKRVLDIGCRDGLFSFEAEKMGASEVLGIDNDLSTGATEFLIPYLKSKVQMRAVNLYEFDSAEPFDFVLFAGVLYHLRFPFLGLKRIADAMKPGGTLLLETAMWATQQRHPLLYCPPPEQSPYEPTSVTFYNDAGLIAALRSLGFANIESRHIMSDDGNTHDSWSEFLSSSYWKPPELPPKPFWQRSKRSHATVFDDSKIRVARVVYTATKVLTADDHLSKYWYGTHSLNSVHSDNWDYMRKFNLAPLS
jgi:SAM-dependent methyltransferase